MMSAAMTSYKNQQMPICQYVKWTKGQRSTGQKVKRLSLRFPKITMNMNIDDSCTILFKMEI